jgi:sugar/nucleoside kinase (ribokinase family)
MFPGVLCCGNIVADLLVRPVEEVRWNASTWIEELLPSVGGNGANTSLAITRLGVAAKLIGKLGEDEAGRSLRATLLEGGVDLSAVTSSAVPTSSTVVLVRSDGARAFLHRPGSSRTIEAAEVLPQLSDRKHFASFHFANPYSLPRLRESAGEIVRCAREAGLTVSMDLGWDSQNEWGKVVDPALPWLDFLFANEEEVRKISDCESVEQGAEKLRAAGVRCLIVKCGERGCMVFSRHGILRQDAYKVDCVDTTGAGDCFVGGFLAARARGLSLAESARIANACGALSVQRLGSVAGLLNWDATRRWMQSRS